MFLRRKKVDKKTSLFFHNVSWLIMGKIVQLFLSFFISILTTRYLGPTKFGLLNLAISYTNFALPLCNLGIQSVLVNELLENKENEGMYLGSGIGIRFIVSFAAIIVVNGLAFLLNPGNRLLLLISLIYSFTLPFQAFDLFEYWYQAHLKSKISSLVILFAYILMTIYKVILLLLKADVLWFAFAMILDYLVVDICYLLLYRGYHHNKLFFSVNTGKKLLAKSSPFIITSFMVMAYSQMDKIMIGWYLGEKAVGYYSTAFNLCNMWTFMLAAIINSARPLIIEARKKDKQIYYKRITQLYSTIIWGAIIVSMILTICSRFIISTLYGTEYYASIAVLRIAVWYVGFSYLGVARNVWSVCEGKQRYEKYFAMLGLLSNIMLNFILIPSFGISGAAVATLMTQIITNIVSQFILKDTRENGLLVLRAFDFKNILNLVINLFGIQGKNNERSN